MSAGSTLFPHTMRNVRVYMFYFHAQSRAPVPPPQSSSRAGGARNCKGHKHNNLHSAHFSHPISSRSLARTFLDDSCVVHCRDFHFMKCFDSTILSRVDQNVLNVAVPAPFPPFIDAQQYLSVRTRLQVDQKCINSSFGAINTMPDVFILFSTSTRTRASPGSSSRSLKLARCQIIYFAAHYTSIDFAIMSKASSQLPVFETEYLMTYHCSEQ